MQQDLRRNRSQLRFTIAEERNGTAAEVKSSPAIIADHFHAIRTEVDYPIVDRRREGRHVGLRIGREQSRQSIEVRGVEQWLVALQVDDRVNVRKALGDL